MTTPKLTATFALLLAFFLIACSGNEKNKSFTNTTTDSAGTNIVVGNKDVTNEVAGSAYIKKAKSYFVINGKDTSDFECTFSQYKDLSLTNINVSYDKKTLSYRQRMIELARILPIASKDFIIDTTLSIGIGRLVSNGDLAIDVTNQYIKKFGENDKASDYKKVAAFLLETKIAADFNTMLQPYAIAVNKISVEKVFFTEKDLLYHYDKVETDSTKIPHKILDCMVSLSVKQIIK